MTTFGLLSLPSEVVPSLKKRMDKKTVKSASGCVEWTGTISTGGYGVTSVTVDGKTRMISAHRASWMLNKGPIPRAHLIDHLCRVRHCINVDHLEPVMPVVNTQRGHASRRLEPPVRVRPPWLEPELWDAVKARAGKEGLDASVLTGLLLQGWLDTFGDEEAA